MSIKTEIEELLGPNVVDDFWVRDSVVLLLRAELERQIEAERMEKNTLLLRAELARQIEAERQAKSEVPDHAPTPRP